jgi:hypothetical protein
MWFIYNFLIENAGLFYLILNIKMDTFLEKSIDENRISDMIFLLDLIEEHLGLFQLITVNGALYESVESNYIRISIFVLVHLVD